MREIARCIGKHTNNVAEWQAAVESLRSAVELKAETVELLSDSKLVVMQFTGEWQVRTHVCAESAIIYVYGYSCMYVCVCVCVCMCVCVCVYVCMCAV